MIIPIVVKVEHPVQLTVCGDDEVLGALDSFAQCLSCILFHLNVVEFPVTNRM